MALHLDNPLKRDIMAAYAMNMKAVRLMRAITPRLRRSALAVLVLVSHTLPGWAAKPTYYCVGAASLDITPDYPVRLCGYGVRQNESEGIDQHIFAQALAIGTDKEGPALVLTVDNIIVPTYMRDALAARQNCTGKVSDLRQSRRLVNCEPLKAD